MVTRLRVLVRQRSGMERKGIESIEFESNDGKLIETSSSQWEERRVMARKRDYRTIQFTRLSKVNEEDARQQSLLSPAFNFARFDRRD